MAENTIDEILVIGKAFANPLGGLRWSCFVGQSGSEVKVYSDC